MNKRRLILYLVFAVYQVGAFIFTVMVDGHLDLLGLLKYIPWFKFISFLGVLLILADLVWYLVEKRTARKRDEELIKENNVLKAKIYDLQQATKDQQATKA
jgi:membrane protein implicated in regulation of membrane protease activity